MNYKGLKETSCMGEFYPNKPVKERERKPAKSISDGTLKTKIFFLSGGEVEGTMSTSQVNHEVVLLN